ncbi:MAG TPA: HAD family phosphatase [Acidimicrobiales bacterium]|nr:HAD family phosphatase [Acidimicrobiales bacterium]
MHKGAQLSTRAAPELVLFDCDGVLVDSERIAVQVEVAILSELGWEVTPEEIVERFLGISDADYLAQVETQVGRALGPDFLAEIEPRYRAAFERELTAVPGVESLLDTLAQAGIKTAVASSGTPDKLRFTLGHTGLWERFEGRVFSATEVEKGKPAPDLFLHAARSLGVTEERCVVVEDSPAGLAGALAAGMRAVAYAGGLVPLERLRLPGVAVATDMGEVAEQLLGRRSGCAR